MSFSPGGGLARIAWNTFYAPFVMNLGFVPGVLTYTTIDVIRPDAVSLGDAYVTWGKASHFASLNDPGPTEPIYDSFGTIPPDKPLPKKPGATGATGPQDDKQKVAHWREDRRVEEDFKVFNPDDHDQYVIVSRVKQILFTAPDGTKHQFDLRVPTGGTESQNTPAEQGPPGPPGATGATGPAGATGATGPAGHP